MFLQREDRKYLLSRACIWSLWKAGIPRLYTPGNFLDGWRLVATAMALQPISSLGLLCALLPGFSVFGFGFRSWAYASA